MKERNIVILLLFFLVFYNAQGVLYAQGGGVFSVFSIGYVIFLDILW